MDEERVVTKIPFVDTIFNFYEFFGSFIPGAIFVLTFIYFYSEYLPPSVSKIEDIKLGQLIPLFFMAYFSGAMVQGIGLYVDEMIKDGIRYSNDQIKKRKCRKRKTMNERRLANNRSFKLTGYTKKRKLLYWRDIFKLNKRRNFELYDIEPDACKLLSRKQFNELSERVNAYLGVDNVGNPRRYSSDDWYPIRRQIYAAVWSWGKSARIDWFSREFAFCRGMLGYCVFYALLSPITLTGYIALFDPLRFIVVSKLVFILGIFICIFGMRQCNKLFVRELYSQFYHCTADKGYKPFSSSKRACQLTSIVNMVERSIPKKPIQELADDEKTEFLTSIESFLQSTDAHPFNSKELVKAGIEPLKKAG